MTCVMVLFANSSSAQMTVDDLLNKFVAKGIITGDEADAWKREAKTNNTEFQKPPDGIKFNINKAIKSVEVFGDLRMRYEHRSARLGPEAGSVYDTANRWRYSLRLGLRGDLADDFYYGLRFETSPNPRSPWNTFGGSSGGQAPYQGPFSKANNFSLFVGQAYLGWKPFSWLDVALGKVPQPLYTTPMVWDSDFSPEGLVEKVHFSRGPFDYFANFGQYIYQDSTPANSATVQGGQNAGFVGNFSDQNAYMLAWQLGATYHVDTNLSAKVAPVFYNYIGRGNGSAGFAGPFVGQGLNGYTYNTNSTTGAGTLPGGSGSTTYPFATTTSYNQTGINNLAIVEFPMELNFKIMRLDAKAFGDISINLDGNARARAAYNAGKSIAALGGNPNPFPGGVQLGQDQAMQFGLAVGNNLGLVYGSSPRRGSWEARAYWQHVEQYALDPNLLDSDFFEGRGNLQGLYFAVAYSFTDSMIATLRYGWAQRINKQLGTGGFNADLPLPNPVNSYQLLQADLTWKF